MLNKYKKTYDNLIKKRKNNTPIGYCEIHHIIPRCLGGDDSLENLVKLTAREHYICHYLLTKIYEPKCRNYYKMLNAFIMMHAASNGQVRYTSRLYEYNRIKYSKYKSESMGGDKNHQYGTMWISNIHEKKNKKIDKNEKVPEGWSIGRSLWNGDERKNKKEKRKEEQNRKKNGDDAIKKLYYCDLYSQYKKGDFKSIREFVRLGHYDKSHVYLTLAWKKYIPEYSHSANFKKSSGYTTT
jgi:hypothetical protein